MKKQISLVILIILLFSSGLPCFGAEDLPKVVFLATGGTIASVKGDNGLRPAYTPTELLVMVPSITKYAKIESRLVLNLDSTNMQPQDWCIIADETVRAIKGGCRGVVIAHGTDTMAYTASALSFMIQNSPVPIVLTGAQSPAGTPGGDAEKNLLNAFQFAAWGPPGVYVVFNGKVIKGVKATKIDPQDKDAFDCANGPIFARFAGIRNLSSKGPDISVAMESLPEPATGPMVYNKTIDPNVVAIKLTPGYRPDLLESFCDGKKIHGLVIEAFGTGNIPFREPLNLIPALMKLKTAGIPVVVVSQCPKGKVDMDIYQTGREAAMTGVIPGGALSKEAALTKLMWALGQTRNPETVRRLMTTDISGELK